MSTFVAAVDESCYIAAMSTTEAKNKPTRQCRRWYQFSLRSLFIFSLVCAVPLAWLGMRIRETRQRATAIAALEKLEGVFVTPWLPPEMAKIAGAPISVREKESFLHRHVDRRLAKWLGEDYDFRQYLAVGGLAVYRIPLHLRRKEPKRPAIPKITDEVAFHLSRLTELESLRFLGESHLTDRGLALLGRLTNLRSLSLECPQATAEGLRHIGRMEQLNELTLVGDGWIDDKGICYLADLEDLRELLIHSPGVTDASCEIIEGFHKLEKLTLRCNPTAAGVAHLARLPNLKWLTLGGGTLDDAAVEHLGQLTSLETLQLENVCVSDRGLAAIARLPRLQTLGIHQHGCKHQPPISDAGLKELGKMDTLTKLRLVASEGANVTREGLECIARITDRDIALPRLNAVRYDQVGNYEGRNEPWAVSSSTNSIWQPEAGD